MCASWLLVRVGVLFFFVIFLPLGGAFFFLLPSFPVVFSPARSSLDPLGFSLLISVVKIKFDSRILTPTFHNESHIRFFYFSPR